MKRLSISTVYKSRYDVVMGLPLPALRRWVNASWQSDYHMSPAAHDFHSSVVEDIMSVTADQCDDEAT